MQMRALMLTQLQRNILHTHTRASPRILWHGAVRGRCIGRYGADPICEPATDICQGESLVQTAELSHTSHAC